MLSPYEQDDNLMVYLVSDLPYDYEIPGAKINLYLYNWTSFTPLMIVSFEISSVVSVEYLFLQV